MSTVLVRRLPYKCSNSCTDQTAVLTGLSELGQAKAVLDNGFRQGSVTQDGGFSMYVLGLLFTTTAADGFTL